MTRYDYAGWMQRHHGLAPALVGRRLLYDPASPVTAWAGPHVREVTRVIAQNPDVQSYMG